MKYSFESFLSSLKINVKICSLVCFFFSPCTVQKRVVVICRPLAFRICVHQWMKRKRKQVEFFSPEWSQPVAELVTEPHGGSRGFQVPPKCVF